MTPSEAFEARLARSDRSTLVGKLLLNIGLSSTNTPVPALVIGAISAGNLGTRASALALIFARYKINYIRLKYLTSQTATGANSVVLGFQDDASGAEGDGPSSTAGLLEYRCSAVTFVNQTIPQELSYQPASRNWYFCTPGATGSDPRLSISAILWASSLNVIAGVNAQVELDYSITFKGAVDVGSS